MEKESLARLLCDFISGGEIPEARLAELSPADWEHLAIFALRFQVGGMLYREIKSRGLPAWLVPADVGNGLRDAYRNHATLNTCLFSDASKVIRALVGNQLPVIALKGLALAKNIYGDIALRPMSDMDLLVKESDLGRAGRILLALGYKPHPAVLGCALNVPHHSPPFTNKSGTVIELHWNIVAPDGPVKVDVDGLWERACLVTVGDVEVRTLSPEDLFLHLCVHACRHLQDGLGLIQLCDIAGLVKTSVDKIDWQVVVGRAARWGARKCVYLMLLLVRDLLGAALPEKIMSGMKPDGYQPVFLDAARAQIFEASPEVPLVTITRRVGQLSEIKNAGGLKGKALVFLEKGFPSKAYLSRMYRVPVSSPKIYLCCFFRLCRLMACYTGTLLRLSARDQSAVEAVRQSQRAGVVSAWLFS